MTQPLRFACLAAVSILGISSAPAVARAQGEPPASPPFPGIPLGPVLPQEMPGAAPVPYPSPFSPGTGTRWRRRWYGWQILAPTLASDLTALGGFFSGAGGTLLAQPQEPAAGWAFFVAGLVGHGLTGPVVHLVHHHPLKALASFALEAALPAAAFAVTFAPCSAGEEFGPCPGAIAGIFFLLPLAMTAGPAIDAGALAWEHHPISSDRASAFSWSVAPVVLPALHAGDVHPGPTPVGAGLAGTF